MVKRSRLVAGLAIGCVLGAPWRTPSAQGGGSVATANVVLVPTHHPRLSGDLSQLWMAPEVSRETRSGTFGQFADAIKLEVDGKFANALPILTRVTPALGPLRGYGEYYTGLAHLRLGDPAKARDIFHALAELAPDGYLAEAVVLREAECAEALGDSEGALLLYEQLSLKKTTVPEDVLMRLAKAAESVGDQQKTAAALSRVYFEYPLSDQALLAEAELNTLPGYGTIEPGTSRYKLELRRADKLFAAKRYVDARLAFESLRRVVQSEDRELVDLRLAECDYFLKRPRAARDALRLWVERASRQGEALYFYAVASRDLGDEVQYFQTIRRVIDQFPSESWAEEALNSLATYYIVQNDDAKADEAFREMYGKYPLGRYADRAAWKIGWWAYKTGRYSDAVRAFESGAAAFPRSDYRPAWLYWSARAHEGLQEPALARARYTLVTTDYLNSYYGRLAVKHFDGDASQGRLVADGSQAPTTAVEPPAPEEPPAIGLPPSEPVIRALLVLKLYDQAIDELVYAQRVWGDSSAIEATTAWIYRQQGLAETGTRQFTLVRGSITMMRRAYPQFLAAGGEGLPKELLKVIYPIAYWDLIQKHAAEWNLDPYVVAALIAQESTFVPDIRSSAAAVGLMQLLPSTARQYARRLKIPYSARTLVTPETNIRIGTAYLADQIREFGQIHLVLASYNAGEGTVRRWVTERSSLALDEFVDDIPFPETQNYVKKILGSAEDYRRLYSPEDESVTHVAEAAAPTAPAVVPAVGKVSTASSKHKPAASVRRKTRAS